MEACTYSTRTKKPEGGGLCYSRLWGEVSGKSLSQKKKNIKISKKMVTRKNIIAYKTKLY